jgi:glutathione S-transferase
MTLTLYHSPFACSLASRFALAETSLAHELAVVSLSAGAQHADSYKAINPRSKVPALQTELGVLTESAAILPYIADLAPALNLMPPAGSFQRAMAQSWLSYLSSGVHPGYTGAFRPERFTADTDGVEDVRAAHVSRIATSLAPIEAHLAERPFLLDALSVCDLYLLVFLSWRGSPALAGKLPAFPALDEFQQRLLARPALAAVMADDMRLMAQQSPYSKAP